MSRVSPNRNEPDHQRLPSRHPYQVWSLGWLALAGAASIIAPQPSSITALLPTWQRLTWSALLLVACLIGLIAAWWRDPATGLLAERAGHAGLAGAALAYAGAIALEAGPRGTVVALLLCGLTVAAVARVRDITRDLRRLEVLAPGPASEHHPDHHDNGG